MPSRKHLMVGEESDSGERRPRRRVLIASLVVLAVVVLSIFPLTVLWPLIRTHRLVSELSSTPLDSLASPEELLERLGGKERGLRDLAFYLRTPLAQGCRRRTAVGLFFVIGKDALPEMRKALRDPRPDVRQVAVYAMGTAGAEAVPDLQQVAVSADHGMRVAAITSLGRIGPEAKRCVPLLLEALRDKAYRVRSAAALALWKVTGDPEISVASLLHDLQEGDVETRGSAIQALGNLGAGAATAIPTLERALQDPSAHVAKWAKYALSEIRTEVEKRRECTEGVQQLQETENDQNPEE